MLTGRGYRRDTLEKPSWHDATSTHTGLKETP
jgi:hypothetical protein